MAKLTLNAAQTAILQSIFTDLDDAFLSGVEVDGVDVNLDMGPETAYANNDLMGSEPGVTAAQQRSRSRQAMSRFLAAAVKRIAPPVGVTTTITVPRLTISGDQGTLTFTDGILTAATAPT